MTLVRELPCCGGCGRWVRVMPFVTLRGRFDLSDAACRHCLHRAPRPVRAALRSARLELRLEEGLEQIVLLAQAWEAVRNSIMERSSRRAA